MKRKKNLDTCKTYIRMRFDLRTRDFENYRTRKDCKEEKQLIGMVPFKEYEKSGKQEGQKTHGLVV